MISCSICLSDDVVSLVDRLHVCKKCLKKIRKYWDEIDVKEIE